MTIEAKVIADSISPAGKRITTLQLRYQRFIHAEVMTHRVFSRNASSSRAIPVSKMIEQVRNDPAMPIHWGKNQPGMQAKEEVTNPHAAEMRWKYAAHQAAKLAESMMELGLHKQVINRILEPFQWIHVVVTATEFDNFFELRAHEDAQPEIQSLARAMQTAMAHSTPNPLQPGEWHLPYVTADDWKDCHVHLKGDMGTWDAQLTELLRKISAARCCRVSYLRHDGHPSTIEEDLALCDRLVGARPLHASPFEHQATPDAWLGYYANDHLHGNFTGWIQHRKLIEQQHWL